MRHIVEVIWNMAALPLSFWRMEHAADAAWHLMILAPQCPSNQHFSMLSAFLFYWSVGNAGICWIMGVAGKQHSPPRWFWAPWAFFSCSIWTTSRALQGKFWGVAIGNFSGVFAGTMRLGCSMLQTEMWKVRWIMSSWSCSQRSMMWMIVNGPACCHAAIKFGSRAEATTSCWQLSGSTFAATPQRTSYN